MAREGPSSVAARASRFGDGGHRGGSAVVFRATPSSSARTHRPRRRREQPRETPRELRRFGRWVSSLGTFSSSTSSSSSSSSSSGGARHRHVRGGEFSPAGPRRRLRETRGRSRAGNAFCSPRLRLGSPRRARAAFEGGGRKTRKSAAASVATRVAVDAETRRSAAASAAVAGRRPIHGGDARSRQRRAKFGERSNADSSRGPRPRGRRARRSRRRPDLARGRPRNRELRAEKLLRDVVAAPRREREKMILRRDAYARRLRRRPTRGDDVGGSHFSGKSTRALRHVSAAAASVASASSAARVARQPCGAISHRSRARAPRSERPRW